MYLEVFPLRQIEMATPVQLVYLICLELILLGPLNDKIHFPTYIGYLL